MTEQQWWVRRESMTLGPYGLDEMRRHVTRGKVGPQDQVCVMGTEAWVAASEAPGIRESFPAVRVAPTSASPSAPLPPSDSHVMHPPAAITKPVAMRAAPEDRWFVHRGGTVIGPFPMVDIHSYLAEGRLQGTDTIAAEGSDEWIPIDTLPGSVTAHAPPPELETVAADPFGLRDAPPTFPLPMQPNYALQMSSPPLRVDNDANPITGRALWTAVSGVPGVLIRGGSSEAWAHLDHKIGLSGWRKVVVTLIAVTTFVVGTGGGVLVVGVIASALRAAPEDDANAAHAVVPSGILPRRSMANSDAASSVPSLSIAPAPPAQPSFPPLPPDTSERVHHVVVVGFRGGLWVGTDGTLHACSLTVCDGTQYRFDAPRILSGRWQESRTDERHGFFAQAIAECESVVRLDHSRERLRDCFADRGYLMGRSATEERPTCTEQVTSLTCREGEMGGRLVRYHQEPSRPGEITQETILMAPDFHAHRRR